MHVFVRLLYIYRIISIQQQETQVREVIWTQQELSGIGIEVTGRRRQVQVALRGGAGLPANKLGVVRPWEFIRSSTPRISTTFLPPSCQLSKRNKLHPFRIFPPALNYHKQMQRRLANWSGLWFGGLCESGGTFLWFPRGLLASGM